MRDLRPGKSGGGTGSREEGSDPRQTDGGTDADPQQGGAAGGDGRSSDREVFSTENATPEKAEGKAISERLRSFQSHGGRITGITVNK